MNANQLIHFSRLMQCLNDLQDTFKAEQGANPISYIISDVKAHLNELDVDICAECGEAYSGNLWDGICGDCKDAISDREHKELEAMEDYYRRTR